jgi:hypothetical protein
MPGTEKKKARDRERMRAKRASEREFARAADEVGTWLEGALECKDWHWDGDQYAYARDALTRMRHYAKTSEGK